VNILVTGATGDIGSAICTDLRESGHVVYTSKSRIEDLEGIRWVCGEIQSLDGLVVCHGAPGCIKPSLDLTDEEFQKIIDVDLVGTFRVCREAARGMIPRNRGHIVVVSSIHALATYPERAAYAAAKAGVCGLVRALAVEWAAKGLCVNAVLPGQVIDTKRTSRLIDNDEKAELWGRSPSGLMLNLQMVAEAVSFLLSSSGISGHSLVVDDAWTASAWFKPHDQR